jgi:MipA family protein
VPYRGATGGRDTQILYLFEGERAYLHATRAGLNVRQDGWRFDVFVAHRFEGYTLSRQPQSTDSMALREPGLDAGVAVRKRTGWGTPYAELTHDVSHNSQGTELKLGYWNEWVRGGLTLRPHAALAWRNDKLNDYYYGVRPGEATAERPAYTPGAGVDLLLGLYGTYRLSGNWNLVGQLTAGRRSAGVRASPIVEDRFDAAFMLGVLYDFSQPMKQLAPESKPLIVRAYYGYSSDCDMVPIMRLACTETQTLDNTEVFTIEAGRTLMRRPFDWPVDVAGFLGVQRHLEKGLQSDFWQVHAYVKGYYYGFPWDKWVRTRFGFGSGLAYAEHVPLMEQRDQARRGRSTWKLLNYFDPTVDVRLGDLFGSRSLKDTYGGLGVSHRSGMFGLSQFFGDVNGGSNWIYFFLETSI